MDDWLKEAKERAKEIAEEIVDEIDDTADELQVEGMKEQKQTVLDSIDEAQFNVSGYVIHSLTEYEKGKFDGLEVAYGIVGNNKRGENK